MQSVASLVISRRMLPQSTPTANSKDVQYNREVGRHNPVQQQVRIPHILKLQCSNVSFAVWLDNHFPELKHSCVPGLKLFAYHNLTLFSSLCSVRKSSAGLRPDLGLLQNRKFPAWIDNVGNKLGAGDGKLAPPSLVFISCRFPRRRITAVYCC